MRAAEEQARVRAEKAQRELERQLEIQRKWKEESQQAPTTSQRSANAASTTEAADEEEDEAKPRRRRKKGGKSGAAGGDACEDEAPGPTATAAKEGGPSTLQREELKLLKKLREIE